MSTEKREYVSFYIPESDIWKMKTWVLSAINPENSETVNDILVDIYTSLKYADERYQKAREEESRKPRLADA